MAVGEPGKHVLRSLDPLHRHPGDVRHHARALDRLARLLVDPPPRELAVDLGDRA
jgi:hypothetical protein